jgi:hypothetical protein
MKGASLVGLVVLALTLGLFLAQQQDAGARPVGTSRVVTQHAAASNQVPIFHPKAETCTKKCSFDSDCSHGKCKSGACGGCSFDSDCKGWGKCRSGSCGGCSFNSDCTSFGECNSGSCTKSPY